MASERVVGVLTRSDPSHLKPWDYTELQEFGEGETMNSYLMDCRRKQKLMWQQLCALDDMLKLLGCLDSAEHFLTETCPTNPGNKAHIAWKALKAEYQEQVEEAEHLMGTVEERMGALQNKRQAVEALLVSLDQKREECKEKQRIASKQQQRALERINRKLEDSLQTSQNALHVCEKRLSELRSEVDEQLISVADWTAFTHRVQNVMAVIQTKMQYRLLSASPSDLCLELLPPSTEQSLQPLRLSVAITCDDIFRLQVFQGTAGVLEESVEGPVRELSAALLEVTQRYISQGDMLAEIQTLHSRFAIDWCPAKRLVIFLKSASTVCQLGLDEGYPSGGRARLLSVRKDGHLLDVDTLQPPAENPALTDWLEFLSSDPAL